MILCVCLLQTTESVAESSHSANDEARDLDMRDVHAEKVLMCVCTNVPV